MSSTVPTGPWLSKRQAAAHVGFSPRTLERAIARGELRASGGGASRLEVRILISDLDAWVKSRGASEAALALLALTLTT
jgi:Helix-turn-helix domain